MIRALGTLIAHRQRHPFEPGGARTRVASKSPYVASLGRKVRRQGD